MGKTVKYYLLLCRRDAHPRIAHGEVEFDVFSHALCNLYLEDYFTRAGKFNGIVEQIEENLA